MTFPASLPYQTVEGALIGTPMYMSPEQCRGATIDHRTDFYSLGVMLYQMVTGRPPFTGPTLASLLVAHMTEAPQPPSQLAVGEDGIRGTVASSATFG